MNNGGGGSCGGAPGGASLVNLESSVLFADAGIKRRDFKGSPAPLGPQQHTAGLKTALSPRPPFILPEKVKLLSWKSPECDL